MAHANRDCVSPEKIVRRLEAAEVRQILIIRVEIPTFGVVDAVLLGVEPEAHELIEDLIVERARRVTFLYAFRDVDSCVELDVTVFAHDGCSNEIRGVFNVLVEYVDRERKFRWKIRHRAVRVALVFAKYEETVRSTEPVERSSGLSTCCSV